MADSGVSVAQPIRLAGSPSSVPSSARVQCEILPVACADGQILALARHRTATAPGWWHALPPGQHPTQAVADALARELDAVFDQSTSVLHSTSWRYESEHLVLSYLAGWNPLPAGLLEHYVPALDTTLGSRAGRRLSKPFG